MKKLSLSIENLSVESFETAAAGKAQGTVYGHEPTRGNNTDCLSAVDACPSGRGGTEIDTCIDPSAYDACPTGFCVPV
jgi:hypothetical protein